VRSIPGRLLNETVVVTPYEGVGADGPTFGTPVTVRAHIQADTTMEASDRGGLVGAARAATATDAHRIWIRPPAVTILAGSKVAARGFALTAVKVLDYDTRGLPGPSHVEIRAEYVGFLPTTTVTILRGTPTADAYGDLVDVATVVASGLEAAIVEEKQTYSAPVDQRGGVVETYSVRLRAGVDVREGDRVRDDRTLTVYRVAEVTHPHTATGPALGTDDVMVSAHRVAATSTPPD
jgi:hypothetical protein